jgi:peptidoglycan/LPS O-acetylase OafA/YrhL
MVAALQGTHPTIFALTRVGPDGVSLFFAISGFLICSRLLEEERLTGRISLKGFYIRRACRILPPAMAYLSVIGILSLLGIIVVSRMEWWSSFFFFRNYLPARMINLGWGGYTVHYWSLAVEEHFYLLWPGLLVLVGKRRAPYLAIGLSAAVAIWRWWDYHHLWMAARLPGLLFGSRTDVRLDGLLMGCLGALLLDHSSIRVWATKHLRNWTLAMCMALYSLIQIFARHHYYSIWESMLLAAMVVITVTHPQSFAGKILEHPVLRFVGRLSYSLYLWQELFAVPEGKVPLRWLQSAPLSLVALVIVASLSYKFVERPMIRLGHMLAPPPTAGRQDLEQRTTFRPTQSLNPDSA